MKSLDYSDKIRYIYNKALNNYANKRKLTVANAQLQSDIEKIAESSTKEKATIAVLTTLLLTKILNPSQDIRYHQAKMQVMGKVVGFSGRTIDSKYVTPFFKEICFPAMSNSGWLTRSFEQKHPFTLDYPAEKKDADTLKSFLMIINEVQENGGNAEEVLVVLFEMLIENREKENLLTLAKPQNLSIHEIVEILRKHFSNKYSAKGASRLPTLAVYAAYECMMNQVKRYEDKELCELESHTAADSQSGAIGDIELRTSDGKAFEGVEIKHEIMIDANLVTDAYNKFKVYPTDRYYLLTTANMDGADWSSIQNEITNIKNRHGCQVIVNGVYTSLKYYLRLLDNTSEFIDRYVELLKTDTTIKFEHKKTWNDIIDNS